MKNKMITLCLSLVLLSCSNDDNVNNCNFLFDAGVLLDVNTNLPGFSQLQFPGNGEYVPGQGNNGLWLWRLNTTTLLAWDAADPSHAPSSCSTLDDIGGGIVECGCQDGNQYSLATGQPIGENTLPCTLLLYRVDNLGNNIFRVSN